MFLQGENRGVKSRSNHEGGDGRRPDEWASVSEGKQSAPITLPLSLTHSLAH